MICFVENIGATVQLQYLTCVISCYSTPLESYSKKTTRKLLALVGFLLQFFNGALEQPIACGIFRHCGCTASDAVIVSLGEFYHMSINHSLCLLICLDRESHYWHKLYTKVSRSL